MAKKKKPTKVDLLKVRGKGTLNQKAEVFQDRRTKRNRTRQTNIDKAIQDSNEQES